MQKNTHIFSLSVLLIASIATLGVSWSGATPRLLSGIFGKAQPIGSFLSSGNAGKIIIDATDSPYGVDVDPSDASGVIMNAKLMFLETVGWVELTKDPTTIPLQGVDVAVKFTSIPSDTTITEWKLAEPLYGWSDNAGWIDFNPTNVSSGLIYRGGGLASFTGQAWSDTLGWLDFSEAYVDFLNKVKVIGNIGGNKTFDVVYNVGARFNSASVTNLLNTIRKNIALMTRGVTVSSTQTDATINTEPNTAKPLNSETIVYKFNKSTPPLMDNVDDLLGTLGNKNRSIIIIGGDLVIDANIPENPNVKTSRAIIVMKNEAGQGGNIYIKSNVMKIYTTLVAEGSVFSGDGLDKYNENDAERDALPSNQLYINGSVISRNTIGGSQKSPLSCPYTVDNCTKDEAAIYDWNYFRTYDKSALSRAKDGYDDYSVIIEYDSRLIQDPPPGLSN